MNKKILISVTIFLLSVTSLTWVGSVNSKITAEHPSTIGPEIHTQDTFPVPPPPPTPPAPGTAKVQAIITAVDSCSTNFILQIKIQNILGYGAATPPLVPNKKMMVHAGSIKQSSISVCKGKEFVMTLQHQEPFGDTDPVTEWSLVEISAQ